jgi:hypothetical protein
MESNDIPLKQDQEEHKRPAISSPFVIPVVRIINAFFSCEYLLLLNSGIQSQILVRGSKDMKVKTAADARLSDDLV